MDNRTCSCITLMYAVLLYFSRTILFSLHFPSRLRKTRAVAAIPMVFVIAEQYVSQAGMDSVERLYESRLDELPPQLILTPPHSNQCLSLRGHQNYLHRNLKNLISMLKHTHSPTDSSICHNRHPALHCHPPPPQRSMRLLLSFPPPSLESSSRKHRDCNRFTTSCMRASRVTRNSWIGC
jgi:hypothetical protein